MKRCLLLVAALVVFGVYVAVHAADGASMPSKPAAETSQQFLKLLEKKDTAEALKLWDPSVVNDKLKTRTEKMSAKINAFGGIKRIDIGTCEDRRPKRFEKEHGEKIDVVPMEIISGNDNIFLAVFEVRKLDGQYRIFNLESLKEWGGTASLDDELPYHN